MKKFYEKSEIWFAVTWIVIYVMVMGNLRGNFGDESIYTTIGLAAVSGILLAFIVKNGLTEKYGFVKVGDARRFLFFIPFVILCTLNLWFGISMHYDLVHQAIAVINMAIVGFAEELIFRGLLFRAIEKENVKRAIIISAVTFGAGHIINLLTGQGGADTVLQILYAIAIGFAFVMVFYVGGSLIPCIVAHSLIDMTSKFSSQALPQQAEMLYNYGGAVLIIVVAGGYAVYLSRVSKRNSK